MGSRRSWIPSFCRWDLGPPRLHPDKFTAQFLPFCVLFLLFLFIWTPEGAGGLAPGLLLHPGLWGCRSVAGGRKGPFPTTDQKRVLLFLFFKKKKEIKRLKDEKFTTNKLPEKKRIPELWNHLWLLQQLRLRHRGEAKLGQIWGFWLASSPGHRFGDTTPGVLALEQWKGSCTVPQLQPLQHQPRLVHWNWAHPTLLTPTPQGWARLGPTLKQFPGAFPIGKPVAEAHPRGSGWASLPPRHPLPGSGSVCAHLLPAISVFE